MLRERIQKQQRITLVKQQVAAMPEYPIYREANGRYLIYIDGRARVFRTESEAEASRLMACADWLRRNCDGE